MKKYYPGSGSVAESKYRLEILAIPEETFTLLTDQVSTPNLRLYYFNVTVGTGSIYPCFIHPFTFTTFHIHGLWWSTCGMYVRLVSLCMGPYW